ncbi:MAG TPA: HD domain-containing protein, partial [Gallionella sp.]
MVAIHTKSAQKFEDTRSWLAAFTPAYTPAEIDVIRRAGELAEPLYAGHAELTGTPLIQHALGAAAILAGMNMDFETIAATILHAVPEYLKDW